MIFFLSETFFLVSPSWGASNFHLSFLVFSVFLLNLFFFFVSSFLQPVLSRSFNKEEEFETKEANVTGLGSWVSYFFSKTSVSCELKASVIKHYLVVLGSLRLNPFIILQLTIGILELDTTRKFETTETAHHDCFHIKKLFLFSFLRKIW